MKLLLATLTALLIIAGGGGAYLLHLARQSLQGQIEMEMERSQELMTDLVRQTSEASIRNYLRGIAEKDLDIVSHFHGLARQGKYSDAEAQARAAEVLLSQKIGDTGYVIAVTTRGIMVVHPKAPGKDVSHLPFVQRQIKMRRGYMEYEWDPGVNVARPKALYSEYFEPWDWMVIPTSYRAEFAKLIDIPALSSSILSVKFGKSGYAYILDYEGKLVVHPTMVGKNIATLKDQQGRGFVQEMLSKKRGSIAYTLKTPGESQPRERITLYREIPELKWIVASTVFTDEVYAPINRLKWAMLGTGLLTLLLCSLTLYLVSAAITRPLGALTARISRIWGELHLGSHVSQMSGTEAIRSRDEVSLLTKKFDQMAIGIRLRDRQLSEHRENLEGLVQKRTAELSERNREMRIVLDTVDQGLVTLHRDGTLGTERSATFERWFSDAKPGVSFHTLLAFDSLLADTFQLAWESLIEDVLPLEVNLELLPKRAVRGKQHFAFEYQPILADDGVLASVLLIVSDITAQVEGLRWEAEQREFLQVFERVMRDKAGFLEFFNEASVLTEELAKNPPEDDSILRRKVHTLKGNAGIFGLQSIAELCHSLETRAAETGIIAMRQALPALVSRWSAFAARVTPLIGTQSSDTLNVSSRDVDALAQLARKQAPYSQIFEGVERLKFEPTRTRFQRIAEQATALAQRLGKEPPVVEIRDNGVRLPLGRWSGFWASFIHAVRNAVDHGLERAACRGPKPARGRIELVSEETAVGYAITIADDGRGIDWEAIRQKAIERGVPAHTQEQLTNALFIDGITSKLEVSDVSGRGVGLGALRDHCRALGGTIRIESRETIGTIMHFEFPKRAGSHSGVYGISSLPPNGALAAPASARPPSPTLDPALGHSAG